MKIFCFVAYYLPGFKAGGALRTVANIVQSLGGEFEFSLLTRDRDLGDERPYEGVTSNTWRRVGPANVYYCGQKAPSVLELAKIIKDVSPNLIYLNSFFDFNFSIKVVWLSRFGLIGRVPILLAPRGEFFEGAVSIKARKKFAYIWIAKLLGVYRDVRWHASSEEEVGTIGRVMGVKPGDVRTAVDLPTPLPSSVDQELAEEASDGEVLRVVFLSRISRKKNLRFALEALLEVRAAVVFDIYGPLEDGEYWEECQRIIAGMPVNVVVRYCGVVEAAQVVSVFSRYDLFFFPTAGENYGHVIAEALQAGTPVLLSDQTPWRQLEADGLGWDLPLDDVKNFVRRVDDFAKIPLDERKSRRAEIRLRVMQKLSGSDVLQATRDIFLNFRG